MYPKRRNRITIEYTEVVYVFFPVGVSRILDGPAYTVTSDTLCIRHDTPIVFHPASSARGTLSLPRRWLRCSFNFEADPPVASLCPRFFVPTQSVRRIGEYGLKSRCLRVPLHCSDRWARCRCARLDSASGTSSVALGAIRVAGVRYLTLHNNGRGKGQSRR